MYEPEVTVITATSNIVENNKTDDFMVQISLLDKQTYPYVEHLIIDNASTDGTDELLKDYKNSGFINFFSERDNGKFDAFNKGLIRAKGKYVAFLSCDDFYHDILAFEYIVNRMEEEDADFCFFPTYCMQPDGTGFQFVPAIYNVFQIVPCPRQAFVFKKSVLDELRGFDTKFKLLADYDLMIKLLLYQYKGVYFESPLVTYNLGAQVSKHTVQADAECRHIFYQNYKSLYPMSDDVLDRMISIGEIPQPLLEKFAAKFPPEDAELFYERYTEIYQIRTEAHRNQRAQERRRM